MEHTVTVDQDKSLPIDDIYCKGWYIKETWVHNSKIHRQFGPAIVIIHPVTCMPLRHEYFEDGERHRLPGPAIVDFDPYTGEVLNEEYYAFGKPRAPTDDRYIPLEPK